MASDNILLYQEKLSENDFLSSSHKEVHDIPLHWHNFIEIEIVLNGTAQHVHNGVVSTLKKGHVSVFRINDYHEIKNTENLEVLNLQIKDNAIAEKTLIALNSIESNLSFELNEETFETIVFFYNACTKENALHNRNEDYIKNILECMLILLLRLASTEIKSPKKHQNSQLHTAVNYLHNHFRENPSLNTIAQIAHYSSTHFSHVFHKKIGKPYNDYLNELKITYAKQLLTTTNLKIIDVGYQSGFNSYNNFYSTFKQYTNLSPAEYKKEKAQHSHHSGCSWRFAMIDTDIDTKPAYVYIDTAILKPNTEYYFSYFYSYDYVIAFESVENCQTNKKIPTFEITSTDLKNKRRTNKVGFSFKTDTKASYRITLKMGKGLNNVNCKYRYTTLSNLTLYETNGIHPTLNLAQDYTFANKNISWTPNSEPYDTHIDR